MAGLSGASAFCKTPNVKTRRLGTATAVTGERRVMAKRSPHSFKKWQKEVKRKEKAQEKMARRQGKKKWVTDADKLSHADNDVDQEPEGSTEEE